MSLQDQLDKRDLSDFPSIDSYKKRALKAEKRIAELEAEMAEVGREFAKYCLERRWIPVGERLPEVIDEVSEPVYGWFTNLDGKYGSGSECVYVPIEWRGDDHTYPAGWYFRGEPLPITEYAITHWMPLPEPPKE